MADPVFPDNTVLCNFAAIERLDLLIGWLRGRGRWTEAVAGEAWQSASHLPALKVLFAEEPLGEAVEIDDPEAAQSVERIRRTVFGGTAIKPTQHLGEAQTCWLIDNDPAWRGAWWVSDDRDAYDFAKRRGIKTWRTFDIMCAVVADGDLTAEQALTLMKKMLSVDRRLYVPSSAVEFR